MRLSSNPSHPDYNPMYINGSVTLNGIHQNTCIWLDTVRGCLIRYKKDDAGQLITIDGEFVTEKVFGRVELKA